MTAMVEWLNVGGDAAVWRSLGLVVADDGTIPLFGTSLRIVEGADEPGLLGWALSGIDPSLDGELLDGGLATAVVEPRGPEFAAHGLGASGLDHVVVLTPDLERTTGAIAASTGCELKRIRDVGPMRQGFHRIGRHGLIVEVVERPEVEEGPAQFWGLVLNVDDLDAACEFLGSDRVSEPKDAVQPGRRIATVSREVGLGLPVALMTT